MHFISIDERFLARLVAVWPKCLSILPVNPTEDTITINLVGLLSSDQEARKIFYFLGHQQEPLGYTADGLAFSKGRIDMCLFLDQERDRYLAYECKRLNVIGEAGRQSLAVPYVMQGIFRFITQQYSEGLPVGCMLGYVMDGDMSFAISSLNNAINDNSAAIGLTSSPTTVAAIGDVERFTTDHIRQPDNQPIHVRHTLLAFPKPAPRPPRRSSKSGKSKRVNDDA